MSNISSNDSSSDKLFSYDRWERILKYLKSDSVTSVDDLVNKLQVSPATIRRDLGELGKLKRLKRVRGGAIKIQRDLPPHTETSGLLGQAEFISSSEENSQTKTLIGQKASELIIPNDAIIIDGGTTTLELARSLSPLDLTVLTTSLPIMLSLLHFDNVRVMVTGGEVFRKQRIFLNPYPEGIIQNFSASKVFIGAQAIGKNGLMQTDPVLVQNEQNLIERAEEVIVLTDSSKFQKRGSLSVCPLPKIDKLITDDKISDEARALIQANNIELITVSLDKQNKKTIK